jgi:hypothetical protein
MHPPVLPSSHSHRLFCLALPSHAIKRSAPLARDNSFFSLYTAWTETIVVCVQPFFSPSEPSRSTCLLCCHRASVVSALGTQLLWFHLFAESLLHCQLSPSVRLLHCIVRVYA